MSKFVRLAFIVGLLQLAPAWLNTASAAGDWQHELEQAIFNASSRVTTSVDGLTRTISIDADTLIEIVKSFLPQFGHAINSMTASLNSLSTSMHMIATNMEFFQSLIEDKNTQIIIAVTAGVFGVAAVCYVADCTVRFVKATAGYAQQLYGWCRGKKEADVFGEEGLLLNEDNEALQF